jgi:NADPH:quinone reductase-like Zn-dependent oxidoreductase
MRAAVVQRAGDSPVLSDFAEPVAHEGESLVHVTAAALSPLTRARASGTHYSAGGGFPFVAGVDGVGRLDDGRRVYFLLPRSPFGGMAERTVVSAAQCVAIPHDLDDVTAATIANPGMSSWAALHERARFVAGESVLINGATGASGHLAIRIARHLGAKRVIATARRDSSRAALEALGADVVIGLSDDPATLSARFEAQFTQQIDVVLDYLWSDSAEHILHAAARAGGGARTRFVQIGTASSAEIALPGALLRSSGLELMGSGIGSVPLARLVAAIDGVFKAATVGGFRLESRALPLSEVESVWADQIEPRLVFTV